jgi:hypothetical protein
MDNSLLLEKYIKVAIRKALKEQEEQQKQAEKSLYLIYRFPGLKKLMEDLMSPVFGRFLKHVDIIAPKPTTFDVKLINGQDFSITYVGKSNFTVKIAGKKYNPLNLGELERASQSIASLLQLNYAPEEGKEQPSSEAGIKSDLAKGGEEPPPPEETPEKEETPSPVAEGIKKKAKNVNEIIDPLSLVDDAKQYIKNTYNLSDDNFKQISKTSFAILLPDGFGKSRTELMSDLEKNSDFKFDHGSRGAGSSIGRLKYKNNILIYIKFVKGQGHQSSGKANESSFYTLINNHIPVTEDGNLVPITVILKSSDKELKYENIIKCDDVSKIDAHEYNKADVQLIDSNNEVAANISLKKTNAVRWESSKRRLRHIFTNFIHKALKGQFSNVKLEPIPGAKNKFKLFSPETNQILSKVIVKNTPGEEDNIVFGNDKPKTIVIKEDFERFNNYTFDNNILTINCNKIYTEVSDIRGTDDEPVFAFSNHIGQAYGIEFRVFSKGLLYKDDKLKGSSTEIDHKDLEEVVSESIHKYGLELA